MEKVRFSPRELSKGKSAKVVIPSGYTELKSTQLIHETEKAYRISFIYEGKTREKWFAKEHCIQDGSKFHLSDWLFKKVVVKL